MPRLGVPHPSVLAIWFILLIILTTPSCSSSYTTLVPITLPPLAPTQNHTRWEIIPA